MATDIRKVILARLKELGKTRYQFSRQMLQDKVPESTAYQFLQGKHPLNHVHLGTMLDVLGLEITPKKGPPQKQH